MLVFELPPVRDPNHAIHLPRGGTRPTLSQIGKAATPPPSGPPKEKLPGLIISHPPPTAWRTQTLSPGPSASPLSQQVAMVISQCEHLYVNAGVFPGSAPPGPHRRPGWHSNSKEGNRASKGKKGTGGDCQSGYRPESYFLGGSARKMYGSKTRALGRLLFGVEGGGERLGIGL